MGKTEDKKYYWIQMPKNWLDTTILKLIKREGGEDAFKYTYIYIWLLLRTTETNGYLYFEHELKTIEKQIAVEIDQPNVIETDSISKLFKILDDCNAIKIQDDYIFMTKLPEMVGSETAKAEYMRQKRKNKKNDNENNVPENSKNKNNVPNDGTTENNVPHSNSNNKSNSNTSNDDDTSGKIPVGKDKYNLTPKSDEDYQALVDEMLSTNPFERPDLSTSVEEEKNLIDEMFHSYDGQKVIRAMKKGKDNGAKSFTYARQILQKQGDSSKNPLKASNQELVIPCVEWNEMMKLVNSEARKDILEETPEEFRNQVLEKTKYYSNVEITDALRMARLELEQSFEGDEDEKVYAYFEFILKFQGVLSKEAVANNVDPQSYILKKFSLLWEKQQE